jgi:hypothetical protein
MNVYCKHCDGEFIAVFESLDNAPPEPLDACECPHCGKTTPVVYEAATKPPARDFTHSGEICTARTPYAYEWWRHNKEFFVQLRYKPRRRA